MRVANSFGMDTVKSVELGATPPPSAEPVSGTLWLVCGSIPDAVCTGAAGGSTDLLPNKPPQTVRVEPATRKNHYIVVSTFEDGTSATVEVAPDNQREIGWSAIGTPRP